MIEVNQPGLDNKTGKGTVPGAVQALKELIQREVKAVRYQYSREYCEGLKISKFSRSGLSSVIPRQLLKFEVCYSKAAQFLPIQGKIGYLESRGAKPLAE